MTDFRFNLKAIKIKKIIAMVMAVCLSVLTVGVDALAVTLPVKVNEEVTVDASADGGVVEVKIKGDFSEDEDLSSLNGDLAVTSSTVSVNGTLASGLVVLKDMTQKVSVTNGVIKGAVDVELPENPTYAKVNYTFSLELTDGTNYFSQDVLLVQDRKATSDYVSSDDGLGTVTEPNVDNFPVYTDPVTTDLDGSGLTTALVGKEIKVVSDKKIVVTVYDGIANGKNLMGNEIAVYNLEAGDAINATAKIQSLYSVFNGGKEITGFETSKFAPAKINYVSKVNGKSVKDANYGSTYFAEKIGTKFATASDRVTVANLPASTTTNLAIKAVWGDADVTPMNGAVNTEVKLAKGQTAVVNYVPTVEKGSKIVVKVTSMDGIAAKLLAKKSVKSAKADAKKGTLTIVASNTTDFEVGRVTLVTVETQKKVGKTWTTTASTEYTVTNVASNVVTSSNGLVLKELYGKTSLTFDKAAAKQTGTLVVEKSNQAMAVKYYAIDVTTANAAILAKLDAGTFSLDSKADKATAKLLKSGKVVKVDANGHVSAKGVGEARVYAVAAMKDTVKGSKATFYVASNGFPITVKSTLVSFKLSGSKTFSIAKTATQVNATPVTIKVTKKASDATDVVAMRVYNAATGKIVLGGATSNGMTFAQASKTVKGEVVKIANTYTYSFAGNKAKEAQVGTYLISGVSPAGDRQTVQISVIKKTK